jgi:hypothetical protein
MQSQEGMLRPPERTPPAEPLINTDPREQQQQRQEPSVEAPNYEERAYEDGYAGLDADDMWRQGGEKLRPKSTGQRNPGGLLLLLVLLCALLVAVTLTGALIPWLSWLLITVLVTGGIVIAILNWHTVTIPMPVQTIAIAEHPRLVINDTIGTISIHKGENGVVSVAPTKHVSGIGVTPENMQVGYDMRDNLLRVSTQIKWNVLQFGLRRIDLEITVPEGCDVQVNNGSGRINADGLHGTIQLRTGSGRIEVSALRGNIALKTGSGSIKGQEINGQLDLKTGSGRIAIQQTVMAGRSRLRTGSGSITFDGALDPRGSYEMKTGSGSVNLALLPDASFQLQASTGSGSITNEFSGIITPNMLQAPLKVKTGSGSIRVHRTVV